MKAVAIILGAGLALGAACSWAQDKACSKSDAAKAEKSIDMVTDFKQLEKAWKDWKQCDEGSVAEVYNDAVMRLLVDWKGIDVLASSMKSNPEYGEWVVRRVKFATKDDRTAVFSRAKTGCPAKLDAFCAQLADAAADVKADAK
jgi:DNA-binding transcriptional LysR family regulator